MAPDPLVYVQSLVVVFISLYSAWLITNMFMIKSKIAFFFLIFAWPVTWVVIPVYWYRKNKAKKGRTS
jgi:hypothetical protein